MAMIKKYAPVAQHCLTEMSMFRTNFESTFSFAQIFNGTLATDTYMLNFKFWNVIVYTHFVD